MKTSEKPWDGRFAEKTDRRVEAFTASIDTDRRLYVQDIEGSIAHCRTLAKAEVITEDEATTLIQGLGQIRREIDHGTFYFDDSLEDIHMHIEARLLQVSGKVAQKLHTARSRNDQVALDVRMYLRQETRQLIKGLAMLKKALVDLAETHIETVLPGYTHLQHAQPVLFSHHLMAYYEMFKRDGERLEDALMRIDVMPLGCAALAGTTYPIDRGYTAELLDFPAVSENSLDGVSDRDFVIEFIAAAAICMMHFSRLSEEMVLWSSAEFGFVELPDAFATGSSIMPQKKNPDVPELVRGRTGGVFGDLMAVMTMMKALPLAYNRDMQEDKAPLFRTVDVLGACIDIYVRMLPKIRVNADRMRSAADTGFLALGGVKGGYGGWLSPTGGPTNQNRSAHPGPVAPDALWSLDFGLTAEPPIVARDGSLVVHYGELACIEPDSSLRWSQDLPGWRSTDPAIDVDGYIYCASYDYNTEYAEIRKVRPADGAAVWTRQTEAPCRLLAPGYGGRLYAEIQRDDYGGEVALQALDESAQLLWELDSLKRSNPHQSYSRPAVSADNSLYLVAGTEGYTFELLAIDAAGQIRWRRQAECSYPEMHVGEVSPMLLDNGNIVVGWNGPFVADTPSSCPAMVACYSPGGDLLWTYETDRDEIKCLAQAPGGRIYAVADYVVLCSLGSAQQARQASRTYDTWLYALEPDGALAWKYGLRYYWGDAAVDADGVVYVVSGFLELHAIKPDGELLWATPIEYCENEHAVLGPNRRLYLMMNWGELVALGPQ